MKFKKQNLTFDIKFLRILNSLITKKIKGKKFFTINEIKSKQGTNNAADHLNKYSYIVIKNFFPKVFLTKINSKMENLINSTTLYDQDEIFEIIKNNEFGITLRDQIFLSEKTKCKVFYDNNFYEMLNYERSNKKFLLEIDKKFDLLIRKLNLDIIIQQANNKKIRKQLNKIYFYKDCNSPRPLHIDTYNDSIKFFIAGNTISKIDDGPYSIIPGTHKKQKILKIMELYNRYVRNNYWFDKFDGSFFCSSDAFIFFTEPGDLIITRQNAVHGDFPTTNQTRRTMIVKHYLF